jgi:hypothetical protein
MCSKTLSRKRSLNFAAASLRNGRLCQRVDFQYEISRFVPSNGSNNDFVDAFCRIFCAYTPRNTSQYAINILFKKGLFQIVALNNPVGIIRSVENTNGALLWHPVGMHPYGMPTTTRTLPFLPSDSFLRNEQKRQFKMHLSKNSSKKQPFKIQLI